MSTHNTPNRLRHTPKTARAHESVIVERQVLHVFVQNEIVMMKSKFEPHFDENANDQYHEENHNTRYHTPSKPTTKLYVKNDDLNTEKTPRTPKPTFEEEQEELKKTLSKDWCDKMDNEDAEEKKLHSFVLYLKQFPIHENKTAEDLLASIECCPKELLRRQKEISKGKVSKAYETYLSLVVRKSRTRQHPRTPCKYAKMSRRGFDGAVKAWRRKLHEFSGDKTKESTGANGHDSISSSQRSHCSTSSSTSICMDENDDNFLPDLYDFEESLVKNTNKNAEPFIDLDVADSMDTIVNNVDSRSAMTLD
ncbi:unnamed protein product [Rotaria magnacalcarata]|uniref:Histone RNA hairpin-binding protein RNA-binding domain-containing protein n=6 Tax=Rotaria magnacalcarata TaxID=392030 RepID=A0A818XQ87_9BILA|nr:unnamed protein product [Rotaria magnacalcarata]CAF3740069.1 unnamed protein product [Rotaria magnacalcarata]